MLTVWRCNTNETAVVVSLQRKDDAFVAVIRASDGREFSASGRDQWGAVISAAMKLFEPNVDPEKRTESYIIRTDREVWYCYVPERGSSTGELPIDGT